MNKLKHTLIVTVAGLVLASSLAWAGGMFQGLPTVSGLLTGNELIPADTALSGGRAPQTEYITPLALHNFFVAPTVSTPTGAPQVAAIDSALNNAFQITLANGNLNILGTPTNITAGEVFRIAVIQDATGSRTLSYYPIYKWAGGTSPTLSTTAAAVDILTFYCYSATACAGTTSLNVK